MMTSFLLLLRSARRAPMQLSLKPIALGLLLATSGGLVATAQVTYSGSAAGQNTVPRGAGTLPSLGPSGSLPSLVVNTAADDNPANAANCPPNPSTSGAGNCSLRDALAEAGDLGGASVGFDPTVFSASNTTAENTITLGSAGTMTIPANTTITGATAGSVAALTNLVTVDGAGTYQVFTAAGTTTLNDLTIANGNSANAGGLAIQSGVTTLNNSTFLNDAATGTGGYGGGVQASGSALIVNNCTFEGNTVQEGGGAIYVDAGTLTITNSTFFNNSANEAGVIFLGGGITATIANSTFAGNSAGKGGVVENEGTMTMTNNLVANNITSSGPALFDRSVINANYTVYFNNTEQGNESDCDGCASNTNSVTAVSNPVSGLGSYGGPTQTMLPQPGSGAICAVSSSLVPSGVTTDQRGLGFADSYCYSGTVDAGAVQSRYSLSFSTEPPATAPPAMAIDPAPVVELTESGNLATAASGAVAMSDLDTALTGTTSASFTGGYAVFDNLIVPADEASDKLAATLTLNPELDPVLIQTTVSSPFSVSGTSQTISFAAPTGPFLVGGSVTLSATASSGLPVSFISTNSAICTVSGTTASLIAGGSCDIEARQWGNSTYEVAPFAFQIFWVNHKTQTISFGAIAAQTLQTTLPLSATATSGLAVSFASLTPSICTVSGTTASLNDYGTCTIQASQTGNSIWGEATKVNQSFFVHHATQTISFPAIAFNQNADSTLPLSATATSGLPVTFTSLTPATCTVSGTTASLNSYGFCTIETSQAGNSVYGAAAHVDQTIFIHHLTQTITFGTISGQSVGTPLNLTATASSGLAVSFTSLTTGVCTVSGATATFSAAGTCTIEATQPGNTVYGIAPAVKQSFKVTP
jgi:predicted outer membrane repeat protein